MPRLPARCVGGQQEMHYANWNNRPAVFYEHSAFAKFSPKGDWTAIDGVTASVESHFMTEQEWQDAFSGQYGKLAVPPEPPQTAQVARTPKATLDTWLYRIAGFVVGAGLIIGCEALLVLAFSSNGYRLVPRGIGWIVVPILAGIAGARIAEQRARPTAIWLLKPQTGKPAARYIGLGSVCWIAAVFIWAFVFNGLGNYWSSDETSFFWKALTVPPLFVAGCYILFAKFGPPH